uniref:COP9 signalosome subunit 7B n=1 Tax=Eptatretus burgeri TaxID=7764 RepID=A0A8C4QU14_EPTBU
METKMLEGFLTQAREAQDGRLAEVLGQAMAAPGVYAFGELLQLSSVQALANGPHCKALELLNIFAYGTYKDYLERADSLPELSTAHKNKLRHLTLVSMASKSKCIPYSLLLSELQLSCLRELEDTIIAAVYADVVRGRLDQRRQRLEVEAALSRDLRPADVANIANTLRQWCEGCEAVVQGIEQQIVRANAYRDAQLSLRQQTENEVSNLRKTMKAAAAAQDADPSGGAGVSSEVGVSGGAVMCRDGVGVTADARTAAKKPSKVKGLRGSGKMWSKSN